MTQEEWRSVQIGDVIHAKDRNIFFTVVEFLNEYPEVKVFRNDNGYVAFFGSKEELRNPNNFEFVSRKGKNFQSLYKKLL